MMLKAREKHCNPLSVMDTMIYDIQSLFNIAISKLSSEVKTYLQQAGVQDGTAKHVDLIFSDFPRMFTGLETKQQQLTYFRTNFNFIVSPLKCFYSCYICMYIGSSQNFFRDYKETNRVWVKAQNC